MILFEVCRKNLISTLRGEYIDFLISRLTFTIISLATGYILFNLNSSSVTNDFIESTGSADYLGFLVIGTALFSTTTGILLNVSRTLMTERREGTLESVLIIPFKRWQYYGGSQLHQFILTGLDAVLAIILASFLGVRFNLNLFSFILGSTQFLITLYGIALITCLIMIYFKDTFFIQNTLLPIILIIGGFLFPVDNLPAPLFTISKFLPISKGLDLIRQGTLLGRYPQLNLELLISFIPGVTLLITGYSLLPTIERRALEDYLS